MRKSQNSRYIFHSFEAKALKHRSFLTRLADSLTVWCGSPIFFALNAIWFAAWIVINTNLIPGVKAFDPFPFGLLTMVVSLEAIFLAIFVLISQNRSSHTSTIRDEVNLQVNMITEQEITKILHILCDMRKEMGLSKQDKELELMLEHINETHLEQQIEQQIEEATGSLIRDLKHVVTLQQTQVRSSVRDE